MREIHERQAMVGIAHRPAELTKRQPAHPAVIELDELTVGLGALLFGEDETVPLVQGQPQQIVEVRLGPARAGAVGAIFDFQLQDTQVDAHLQYLASVARPGEPGDNLAGLVLPALQHMIDILALAHQFVPSVPGLSAPPRVIRWIIPPGRGCRPPGKRTGRCPTRRTNVFASLQRPVRQRLIASGQLGSGLARMATNRA